MCGEHQILFSLLTLTSMNVRHSPESKLTRVRHAGFTLIELLVVISIIAILTGVALSAISSVMVYTRKTQAKSIEVSLVNAINSYKTEYNRFPQINGPIDDGGDGPAIDTTSQNNLVACLLGLDKATNPQTTKYLTVSIAKNGANGYDASSGGPRAGWLLDPWKNPFHVVMDYNGDGFVTNPYYNGNPTDAKNLPLSVIVYSDGPDGISGVNGKSTDDVKSWQ
jgi:prepilin-type N-terminal cleavage/methylation domain-containing protein